MECSAQEYTQCGGDDVEEVGGGVARLVCVEQLEAEKKKKIALFSETKTKVSLVLLDCGGGRVAGQ